MVRDFFFSIFSCFIFLWLKSKITFKKNNEETKRTNKFQKEKNLNFHKTFFCVKNFYINVFFFLVFLLKKPPEFFSKSLMCL